MTASGATNETTRVERAGGVTDRGLLRAGDILVLSRWSDAFRCCNDDDVSRYLEASSATLSSAP